MKELKSVRSIAFDMDNVITDTFDQMVKVTSKELGIQVFKEEFKPKDFWKLLPEPDMKKEIFNLINQKGFFRNLAFMENKTREVLEEINKNYEVYICTAAMEVPNSFEDKFLWLRENLPFLDPHNFVFCGNKKAMKADILVDDTPSQLHSFTGTGILYTSPFNEEEESFYRVNNWDEIGKIFL